MNCDRWAHKRKRIASNKRQYCMSLSGYKRVAVTAQEATFAISLGDLGGLWREREIWKNYLMFIIQNQTEKSIVLDTVV